MIVQTTDIAMDLAISNAPPSTDPQPADDGDIERQVESEVDDTIGVAVDRWSIGQVDWPDVWLAFGILAVAAILAWGIRRFTRRSTRALDGPAAAAITLIGQIVTIGIFLFAFAVVLEVLGFTLGPVLIIALLAIVLLIVLRPLISNVSAGLLLQVRGYCRPGDVVRIDGEVGTVDEVNTRAVMLHTADGRTVVIPNDKVIGDTLVNYSKEGQRRSHIAFMLPGAIDLDLVTDRVVAEVRSLDVVLDEPPPRVMVTGFGGTQVWAEVQFWFPPDIEAELTARDEVARALSRVFNADARLSDSSSIVHVTGT